MTSSNGDLPVGETVDIEAALQEVSADDAAETASAEPSADEAAQATDRLRTRKESPRACAA